MYSVCTFCSFFTLLYHLLLNIYPYTPDGTLRKRTRKGKELGNSHRIMTTPKTWFITGCSSGFGESLVKRLRAEGDNVIATGRQADVKLAHLRETGAHIMDLDVAAPEGVILEKVAEAWDVFPGGVDVVVNNAGYILAGLVEELT